jgi:hypothetical protein
VKFPVNNILLPQITLVVETVLLNPVPPVNEPSTKPFSVNLIILFAGVPLYDVK